MNFHRLSRISNVAISCYGLDVTSNIPVAMDFQHVVLMVLLYVSAAFGTSFIISFEMRVERLLGSSRTFSIHSSAFHSMVKFLRNLS